MRYIYAIYFGFFKVWFFYFKLSRLRTKRILMLVDLDNTLCDTWPLLKVETDMFQLYARVDCFYGVKNFIKMKSSECALQVVYLSARNIKFYSITKKWISNHDLVKGPLFLTSSINCKEVFLKHIISANISLIVMDDLSYNHENGIVLKYDNTISYLDNMDNVRFINGDELEELQKLA